MFRDSHIVRMDARFIFAFCAIYFRGVQTGQNQTVQRTAGNAPSEITPNLRRL